MERICPLRWNSSLCLPRPAATRGFKRQPRFVEFQLSGGTTRKGALLNSSFDDTLGSSAVARIAPSLDRLDLSCPRWLYCGGDVLVVSEFVAGKTSRTLASAELLVAVGRLRFLSAHCAIQCLRRMPLISVLQWFLYRGGCDRIIVVAANSGIRLTT